MLSEYLPTFEALVHVPVYEESLLFTENEIYLPIHRNVTFSTVAKFSPEILSASGATLPTLASPRWLSIIYFS